MTEDIEPAPPSEPRPWERRPRAFAGVAFAIGVVLGALTILLPGLHLVGTWLCPLLGSVAALWLWRQAPPEATTDA